jgi:hypothetical protein
MDRDTLETQKEIVRLLAVLVKRDRTQSALIAELDKVGFSPKRISELLDTSSNTVSVALHGIRKNKK